MKVIFALLMLYPRLMAVDLDPSSNTGAKDAMLMIPLEGNQIKSLKTRSLIDREGLSIIAVEGVDHILLIEKGEKRFLVSYPHLQASGFLKAIQNQDQLLVKYHKGIVNETYSFILDIKNGKVIFVSVYPKAE